MPETATDAQKTKYKMTFDEEIKYSKLTLDNAIDGDKLPTYVIKDCQVGFSSLTQKRPEYGHTIQIILPEGTDFVEQDRARRKSFASAQSAIDPNIEVFDSMVKIITSSDVTKKKMSESLVGRANMFFQMTNKKYKDVKTGKFIKDLKTVDEGTEVQVIYFAKNDQFTGEPFKPEIFKYGENGNKVHTFVSKKDGAEKPLYVGKNDIVNIHVREYASHNSKDNKWSLKYNLLAVEIVKTDFEQGGGEGSGYTAEGPNMSVLSAVYGITESVDPSKAKSAESSKVAKSTEVKAEESLPKADAVKKESKKAETKIDPATKNALDSLAQGLDLASLGIGNVGGAAE